MTCGCLKDPDWGGSSFRKAIMDIFSDFQVQLISTHETQCKHVGCFSALIITRKILSMSPRFDWCSTSEVGRWWVGLGSCYRTRVQAGPANKTINFDDV